ncbi:LacI family transcriptional regulator [Microlunatus elymi]|uniref:LacI family transcriptional regulator n=1 Tax=Microlunatus elymi TaxID=2596828 RepID=A0A516PVP6_9ACTN|nr:LacI family DNA-binding transcriptional regulator [Microlunatus elymi]QDP95256.1 LacI family transcriptional regulator [Microlunatus elymi]
MPTIKDVAERAGVSVATVSRALNGVPSVDPVLAKRVHAAARALGYRANGVARSLRRRQTDVWALIISDVANPFFTAIARGVEDVAQQAGYSVLLCNADEDAAKEARYLEVAERSLVSGVLLSPTITGSDIGRLQASGVPVVTVDRNLSEPVDSVLADSATGAFRATEHLLEQGWRRPACITGPRQAATAEDRMRGFLDALARHRIRRGRSLVRHTNYRADGGREATAELLDAADPPDALFVANSELALGALEELTARGLRLGRDIGMVAFDDAPWAAFIEAPLSVVAQPAYEIGVEAARLLLDRITAARKRPSDHPGAPAPPRTVLLGTRLIVRESSRRHR